MFHRSRLIWFSLLASICIIAIIVMVFINQDLTKDEQQAEPPTNTNATNNEEAHIVPPSSNNSNKEAEQSPVLPEPIPEPDPEPVPYRTQATLTAVGDIMMHSPQLTAAYDAASKTYSFDTY